MNRFAEEIFSMVPSSASEPSKDAAANRQPVRDMTDAVRLPEISVYDVGANFSMEIAERMGERSYQLLAMATRGMPVTVVHLLDRLSRWWLARNRSPYLAEIEALARRSREPGIYFLNLNYEWGCTTAARPGEGGKTALLLRTLDWGVSGVGRFVVAARISNPLGAWISLTWPAFTGVIQGMAPGRFAAAINQPMPPSRLGLLSIDSLFERYQVFNSTELQPVHLLRRVFETAQNFPAAKAMLETTPISAPAIFTLAGLRADESVVIERRARSARMIQDACAANEWQSQDWRTGHHSAFENEARLAAMRAASRSWDADLGWLEWPLLNDETRLAMMAEPATGRLLARGYEAGQPATRTLIL